MAGSRASASRRQGSCLGPAILAATVILLTACRTTPRPEPITQDQVVELFEEGAEPEVVLTRMKAAGMVYALRARDVVDLIERGVPEEVVDYMLDTRLQNLDRRVRYGYAPFRFSVYRGYYGSPFFGSPFYGYPYCF